MECLSCGECCKIMSPINGGYCPLLLEKEGELGKIYYCSDYDNRPQQCKNHSFPAHVCPVGVSTMNLINDALVISRIKDIRFKLNIN